MLQFNKYIRAFFAMALPLLTLLSSCIHDKNNECKIDVIFDYSHNILSTNAFEKQVGQVALYVFDQSDKLVATYTDAVTPNFSMRISALAPGKYKFVAWAQDTKLANSEASFQIPDMTIGNSSAKELAYYMKRNEGVQQSELNNFLVGTTTVERIEYPLTVKIDLKKVNNKFRVALLPYNDNIKINADDYKVGITDKTGNGYINNDYTLLPDQPITYRPYAIANDTSHDGVVLELNTSRLMATNNTRLVVESKQEPSKMIEMDLIRLLSLVKGEESKGSSYPWSLQEYLDRQDEYAITFLFDPESWITTTIIINGWVINEIEL